MKAGHSLRGRLLAMLLLATAGIWLSATAWNYRDARHEAEEMLDAQLAQSARLLLAQTRHELVDEGERDLGGIEFFDERVLHPYEQKLLFRIRDTQGHVLLTSTQPPPEIPAHILGYADVHEAGLGWRVLVNEGQTLRVEVAQSLAIREELARHVATHLAFPILLVLPLLGGLIYLLVGRALRPLDALAATMSSRTAAHLAPVEGNGLPRELLPLVAALNSLLTRLDHALDSERRFTADAAHELRTPLAAIQVQVQVALATQTRAGRDHALQQVLAGSRRATRLVEQLLRLARLDPLASLPSTQPVSLAALAREVIEELTPEAWRIELEGRLDATVDGDRDLLRVALRNLLDNALRYSPQDSRVVLRLAGTSATPRLQVDDQGPGVPADELPRLTERFYRGGESTREGSGLGLAIVARIAQLHGACLHLENRGERGLRAELDWTPH